MTPFVPAISTLAVSTIYCILQFYYRQALLEKHRRLRERVAYLLWVVAERAN
jgi:hypothetical protein